jgi:hypothetical protein
VKEGEFVVDLEHRKKKTLAIISIFMKDEIMPYIARILDPTTMWQTLKNSIKQQSGARCLHLKTKLTNFLLKERKFVINFMKQLKNSINQLVNIGEMVPKKDIVEQILNSLPKNMESLSNILLYRSKLPTFNDLIRILLHDEAKKELRGKRTKNEALFLKTEFGKVKNWHEMNNHKGLITKHEGNCNFC